MKTYLVTGAAGFVGSKLSKKLLEKDNIVVTVDNLSTGFESAIPRGVIFYKGNVQDEIVIEKLEKYKFDCIFHIAGQSSGEISYDDPIYDLQTNAQSTLLLLKLAQKTGCKKFIYASTMSVYGDNKEFVCEEDATEPKSFYGVGKLASEKYLKICSNDIVTTSLRLFNIYGPGQNMKNMRQGMVSIFLQQALTSNQIEVKGSLKRFRDFIYIDDVVSAFLSAENRKSKEKKIYNIGTGIKHTVSQLIETISSNFEENILISQNSNTPGDQFGIYSNSNLAIKELNWKPNVLLKEGMEIMVDHYRK
jgi:UDP-glucose 4-epimerase